MIPTDLDAEGAVLGGALLKVELLDEARELLEPEYFYSDANRTVWEALCALHDAGRTPDLVTVASELKARQKLDQVGGTPYLTQLSNAPAVVHASDYAATVRDKWRLRQALSVCRTFTATWRDVERDVTGGLEDLERQIYALGEARVSREMVDMAELSSVTLGNMLAAKERGGVVTGIETGFLELDRLTLGMHRGDLTVVAGRPGMGKSAVAQQMAANIAEDGGGVALFSLEMPREQLGERFLAIQSRLRLKSIRSGQLTPEDWQKATELAETLGRLPILVDDTPALTLVQLRGRVRRAAAELSRRSNPLSLVAVDYLQLMSGKKDSREQEIAEISRGLKELAKQFKVPVLALSQLNRSCELRSDKRPLLSDLRESGAIEQDADNIVFVYRDEYYNKNTPDRGIAELIVAKQRNGPTGKVRMRFTDWCTRFDNLAEDEYDLAAYDDFAPAPPDYGERVSP